MRSSGAIRSGRAGTWRWIWTKNSGAMRTRFNVMFLLFFVCWLPRRPPDLAAAIMPLQQLPRRCKISPEAIGRGSKSHGNEFATEWWLRVHRRPPHGDAPPKESAHSISFHSVGDRSLGNVRARWLFSFSSFVSSRSFRR